MIGQYIVSGVGLLLTLYYYAMIFYIISSWIPALRANFVGQWVEKIVDPYLGLFRKFIPPIGMLDISPLVGFFVYNVVQRYVLEGVQFILQTIHLL